MSNRTASAMSEAPEGAGPQQPLDEHLWMRVHHDLDLMMNPVNRGAWNAFQGALQASLSVGLARSHWEVPGAGADLEEVLKSWEAVTGLTGTPEAMGYISGAQTGIGASWQEGQERWRAVGEDEGSGSDSDDEMPECCYRHPGDKPSEDFGAKGTEEDDDGWSNPRFAPLTTKASEQVYCIQFAPAATAAVAAAGAATAAAAAEEEEKEEETVVVRSAYQNQLHVRVDRARKLLVYDCFEFLPGLFRLWKLPITKQQLHSIQQALYTDDMFDDHDEYGYGGFSSEESSDDDAPIAGGDEPADMENDQLLNLHFKKLFGDFKKSRVFRLRVPFTSIIGIRVVRGGSGPAAERGFCRLVVELASPPPASGFAVRTIKVKQDKMNLWERIDDWTPGKAASSASRHYISGSEAEIVELANYLGAVCPRLKSMLLATPSTVAGALDDASEDPKKPQTKTTQTDPGTLQSEQPASRAAAATEFGGDTTEAAAGPTLTIVEMCSEAILALKERDGSARQAIKVYVYTTYGTEVSPRSMSRALKDPMFVENRGKFQLADPRALAGQLQNQQQQLLKPESVVAANCGFCSVNTLVGVAAGGRSSNERGVDMRPSAAPAFVTMDSGGSASAPVIHDKAEEDKVHAALRSCGVKRPERVSMCLRKALLEGYYDISGWQRILAEQRLKLASSIHPRLGGESLCKMLPIDLLDKVASFLPGDTSSATFSQMVSRTEHAKNPLNQDLITDSCADCGRSKRVRIKHVLRQRDYAGMDYEDGGQDAAVQCSSGDCGGIYVTGICRGQPRFDSGKFHNHCTQCPGFGECLGDYREAHCSKCGGHWFAGNSGFPCSHCGGRKLKPMKEGRPPDSWSKGFEGLESVPGVDAQSLMHRLMTTMRGLTPNELDEDGMAASSEGANAFGLTEQQMQLFAVSMLGAYGMAASSEGADDDDDDDDEDEDEEDEEEERQQLEASSESGLFVAPEGAFSPGQSSTQTHASQRRSSRVRQMKSKGKKKK